MGIAKLVWTGFGLGLSPIAPGTCGTLLGVGLALVLPEGWLWIPAVATTLLGVPLARRAERHEGRTDPGCFVLDEVAGYCTAMLFLPHSALALSIAFVAFRVFDIFKPWPIRRIERLPKGWGVMADDLWAGAYAQVVVRLLLAIV